MFPPYILHHFYILSPSFWRQSEVPLKRQAQSLQGIEQNLGRNEIVPDLEKIPWFASVISSAAFSRQ
jgi:hypothetical protein